MPGVGFEPTIVAFFFFFLDYETIGAAATPGLLCQPRVIMKMIVESMMECRLAGETYPSATFVHHKIPHAHPGLNPGRRGGKSATNRLSYGAAYDRSVTASKDTIVT
jgi:hypothetical protein